MRHQRAGLARHGCSKGWTTIRTTRRLVAGAVATESARGSSKEGFTEFHFYTLNRADLVYASAGCWACAEADKPSTEDRGRDHDPDTNASPRAEARGEASAF